MSADSRQFDVLIVGGGPAGSTLAWALRDAGLSIAILDKQTFPRDKVCAGWVTPAVLEELSVNPDEYAQSHTLQPIYAFRVSQLGKREVETRHSEQAVSYSIRRCEFDDFLLHRSGATLILGEKFKDMQKTERGWRVNGKYDARLVVGAGGHFCPVARQMGAKLGQAETVVAAQEIEFEMTSEQLGQCSVEAAMPELFFCEDLKGYGWVVRKNNFLNIGLGREDNHKLAEHVAQFRQLLIHQGKIPADTPEKFHGHAYLLYPHAKRPLLQDGVIIIGDAAGLAYPQSGEGIRPAIESALLAAQVIKAASGDYSQQALQGYTQQLEARFGQREKKDLTDYLPQWFKQSLASSLLSTEWFVRKVVVDRWFLHNDQAPLTTV
ncbi:MAG: FAD-dependent oxidoreductase [Gammaproteobacteria bacterium]|nr:FAD-dependent oxidoreductase [Gammaproteobacteria bacterium]